MKLTVALVFVVLACALTIEAANINLSARLRHLERDLEYLKREAQDYNVQTPRHDFKIQKRGSCITLGGTGCEGNNGKCCREGNPYTGTMRKCVNKGSFDDPIYKCVEK